jgi:CheY-like chemotaxis protein
LQQEHHKALGRIDTSGKNLLAIINDILDISKIEAGRMELHLGNFNLNQINEDMNTLFKLKCEEKNLNLETSPIPENRCHLYGDEEKLRQVLINLLSNAVKFTDSGTVSLNIIPEQNNKYRFEVRDTGKGIDKEAQKTIFEPFKQDAEGIKKGGTGLGLAICRKQILLMGSDLYVTSEIDEGSCFYFTIHLPSSRSQTISTETTSTKVFRISDDHHVKALIADDNPDNRTVLCQLLRNIGVDVIEAENGSIALEKIRKHLPNIIFMDIRMPVMDGREAMQKIREEFGPDRFKIVTITASAMQHNREEYLKMGSHEVILKPFKINEIFDCLKNLLNIEYSYSETLQKNTEPMVLHNMDYSQVHLPKTIHDLLTEAATLHHVTGIRQSLPLLIEWGKEGEKLADNLNLYLKSYDMKKILSILDQVNIEK